MQPVRRILFVMPTLGGGAEVFVEIAAGLRRRGLEVEMLAPRHSRAHELDVGVRFHYYDVAEFEPETIEAGPLFMHAIWGYAAHREILRLERDFDAVFIHLSWGCGKIYAERRDGRRPLVGFADVSWADYWDLFQAVDPPEDPAVWASWKIMRHMYAGTMRACDRLLAPSRFFADFHARDVGRPIDVIRHGRDPARYLHGADKAALRARLGLPEGKKIILSVGLEFGRKGMHRLAELALRIRDEDVLFVAIGPPSDMFAWWRGRDPTLDARLLVRHAPHQEVPAWFACADIFLFLTYFESFGLAPVEAMASGVPVVAHAAASIPELFTDGVEGYLLPVSDLDRIEARLRELLADPAKRRAMGEAARARFLRDHTEARMLDEYEAFFRELPLPPLTLSLSKGERAPA